MSGHTPSLYPSKRRILCRLNPGDVDLVLHHLSRPFDQLLLVHLMLAVLAACRDQFRFKFTTISSVTTILPLVFVVTKTSLKDNHNKIEKASWQFHSVVNFIRPYCLRNHRLNTSNTHHFIKIALYTKDVCNKYTFQVTKTKCCLYLIIFRISTYCMNSVR